MRRELIESYYEEYQRELERFLESDPEMFTLEAEIHHYIEILEPAYADGGDEMVIDSVTMDRIGVPLLTIDARDGSVVQRVQSGPSTTFPGGIGECE